jgi:hypothetical protein
MVESSSASISDVICSLEGYEAAFPTVMEVLKIAVMLGVSSASTFLVYVE